MAIATENAAVEAAKNMIASVNAIEGFDPSAVAQEVAVKDAAGNPVGKKKYLPLMYKKAWARKVFPSFRCHAEIKSAKDGQVLAYAAFYPTDEPDKAFTGEGFAVIPYDERGGVAALNDAVLKAIGSAKSRALTEAGFGMQFFIEDCIDDLEAEATEAAAQPTAATADAPAAPIKVSGEPSLSDLLAMRKPEKTEEPKAEEAPEAEAEPAQGTEPAAAEPEATPEPAATETEAAAEAPETEAPKPAKAKASKAKAAKKAAKAEEAEAIGDGEQISLPGLEPAGMTVDEAKAVVSSVGIYAGKTMGEVEETSTKFVLIKLFERTPKANADERLAIKTIVDNDSELTGYCKRNNKVLAV